MGESKRRKQLLGDDYGTEPKAKFFKYDGIFLALNHGSIENTSLLPINIPSQCTQYQEFKNILDWSMRELIDSKDGEYIYGINSKSWVYKPLTDDIKKCCELVLNNLENNLSTPRSTYRAMQFLNGRGDTWEPSPYYGIAISDDYKFAVCLCGGKPGYAQNGTRCKVL